MFPSLSPLYVVPWFSASWNVPRTWKTNSFCGEESWCAPKMNGRYKSSPVWLYETRTLPSLLESQDGQNSSCCCCKKNHSFSVPLFCLPGIADRHLSLGPKTVQLLLSWLMKSLRGRYPCVSHFRLLTQMSMREKKGKSNFLGRPTKNAVFFG